MLDLVKVKVRFGKSKVPLTMLVHDSAAMGYFHSPGLFELAQKLEQKGFNLADHICYKRPYTPICPKTRRVTNLERSFVDNYMNTYSNADEMISDKVTLDNVMSEASMPLQEWVSNDDQFNSLYKLVVPVTQNVLGISWNPITDNMNIVVGEKLNQEISWRYTKRKILSLVSSIYDPLGWVSPLTVCGKMFLQTLWKEKMGWDQKLNPDQIRVIYDILVDL